MKNSGQPALNLGFIIREDTLQQKANSQSLIKSIEERLSASLVGTKVGRNASWSISTYDLANLHHPRVKNTNRKLSTQIELAKKLKDDVFN